MSTALAPWGANVLARARDDLRAPDVPHSGWVVLAVRDNLVLANQHAIAKVTRPGGEARVANGLATALADGGAPAVRPLALGVTHTALGATTFWPRVEHTPLTAAAMPVAAARAFGAALGAIAHVGHVAPLAWNPFARLTSRLAAGATWSEPGDLARLQDLTVGARAWVRDTGVDELGVLAHGDVSLTNALWTADGIRLIDFDSAAVAPPGWDLACLLLRLTVEGHNPTAADAVRQGWSTHAAAPSEDELAALVAVKLVMGTSFLLTLGHDARAREAFHQRLDELEEPLRQRRIPATVTPID